jgi:hypothetical protein
MLKNVPGHPSYMGEEVLVGRGVINRFETVLDGFVKEVTVKAKR